MLFPSRLALSLSSALALCSAATILVPGAVAAPDKKASSVPNAAAQKIARRAITAQYEKSAAAMKRKDAAALAAMEAPDYRSYSPGGTSLDREQELARTRQFFASLERVLKFESRILSLTWRGPDAVIKAQNTGVFVIKRGGQTLRVETVDISRDFWSRTDKGWQIRQVVHGEPKTWVNGKRTQ